MFRLREGAVPDRGPGAHATLGVLGKIVFPICDAHGNNVATLSRNGLGYQISNRRSFDAWGSVRLGSQTGDPTGRYCANLGHKQDDESGLIYMRARYYEPTSGRFVSEDPAMDGGNWFSYCGNEPIGQVDRTGRNGVATTVDFWPWATDVFAGWGIHIAALPRNAQIVANTIATVELFEGLSTTLSGLAGSFTAATAGTMWMMGSQFAWVPGMLAIAAQGARFGAILCKVIALATFAQCALLLYIEAIDNPEAFGL